MSERLKHFLKISGFAGVTVLLALAIYIVFFRPSPAEAPVETPDDGTPATGLPSSGVGGERGGEAAEGETDANGERLLPSQVADGGETFTTLLTTSAVTSPTTTENGTVAYYDPADGRFYTIDDEGNVIMLSRTQFPEATSVVFAPFATAAVIEFPDGSNVVYDFAAASQATLPTHWEEFSFTADGVQIVGKSIGTDPSNRALVVSSIDGSSTEVIASIGENSDKIDVNVAPGNAIVGFSRTGGAQNAFGRQEIYLIGMDGEASGVLIVDGSNFEGIWDPNGSHLLYSVADPGDSYRPALWYVDSRGDRRGDVRLKLGIKTTVEKCTFASETTIFCAVPREVPAGSGSAIATIDSPDDLYAVSTSTGRATLAAIPAADTQMFNLSVSSDGSILFYTDGQGRLNSIKLQ